MLEAVPTATGFAASVSFFLLALTDPIACMQPRVAFHVTGFRVFGMSLFYSLIYKTWRCHCSLLCGSFNDNPPMPSSASLEFSLFGANIL